MVAWGPGVETEANLLLKPESQERNQDCPDALRASRGAWPFIIMLAPVRSFWPLGSLPLKPTFSKSFTETTLEQ